MTQLVRTPGNGRGPRLVPQAPPAAEPTLSEAVDTSIDQIRQSVLESLGAAAPAPTPPAAAPAAPDAAPGPFEQLTGQRPTPRLVLAYAAALALLLLAGYSVLSSALRAPTPAAAPTAAPAAAPAVVPTAQPAAPTARPPLAAYWAPGGQRAPDIDRADILGIFARYGETWVRLTLAGGGEVWVAWADAPLPAEALRALPDLAPQPTPLVVEREVLVTPVGPACVPVIVGDALGYTQGCDVAAVRASRPSGQILALGEAEVAAFMAQQDARAATTQAQVVRIQQAATATAEARKPTPTK